MCPVPQGLHHRHTAGRKLPHLPPIVHGTVKKREMGMGIIVAIECLGISALLYVIGQASGMRRLRYPMIAIGLVMALFMTVFMAAALLLSLHYVAWLASDRVQISDASPSEVESHRFSAVLLDIGTPPASARIVSAQRSFLCFRKCTDHHDFSAYCLTPEQIDRLPITTRGYDWAPPSIDQPYAPIWFAPRVWAGSIPPGARRHVFVGEGCWVFVVSLWHSA